MYIYVKKIEVVIISYGQSLCTYQIELQSRKFYAPHVPSQENALPQNEQMQNFGTFIDGLISYNIEI